MNQDFDPSTVRSGCKEFGYIKVVDNVAAKVEMPVGVVNGSSPGPTFIVTGGLYPTEYCGVEAASRLFQQLNPEELSGRLIIVPVVNMPVFRFRTPWLKLRSSISPMDGENINRLFPGDSNGTVTNVLAFKLFELVLNSDYHVDFRGGDLPESHLVHTIYLRIGREIDDICEDMAKVFGLEYVLPGTPKIGHTSKGTLIYEAVDSGIPSIISESGLGYRTQPLEEFVIKHVDGVKNLLKHFGMLAGDVVRPRNQRFLDMEWQIVKTPVAGIFHAFTDQGDVVSDGEIIGKVTGLDGLELAKIVAPIEGVVHTMYPRRVVYPGDRLYTLLKIGGLTGY